MLPKEKAKGILPSYKGNQAIPGKPGKPKCMPNSIGNQPHPGKKSRPTKRG